MAYIKNFDQWNNDKQKVDKKHSIHVKKGEIWLCKLGINVGHETDGKNDFLRPVVILQTRGNIVLIAPMTLNEKRKNHKRYHQIQSMSFGNTLGGNPIISLVILTQIKTIDSRRCFRKKGNIHKNELMLILDKIHSLF